MSAGVRRHEVFVEKTSKVDVCRQRAYPLWDASADRGVWLGAVHGVGTQDSANALATEADDRVLIAANEPPKVDKADATAASDLASGP